MQRGNHFQWNGFSQPCSQYTTLRPKFRFNQPRLLVNNGWLVCRSQLVRMWTRFANIFQFRTKIRDTKCGNIIIWYWVVKFIFYFCIFLLVCCSLLTGTVPETRAWYPLTSVCFYVYYLFVWWISEHLWTISIPITKHF